MRVTPFGKAAAIGLIVAGLGFGVYKADGFGYFNTKPIAAASVTPKFDYAGSGAGPATSTNTQVNLAPVSSTYTAKLVTIPWNAAQGLLYANGGVISTPDSLMAKRGVKLQLVREDDYGKMLGEMIIFAKAVAAGNNEPKQGAAFALIMGDGYPAFIAGAQEQLSKINQQLEVIVAVGYSRGEDKCMLPSDVKVDPQRARGALIGAVLRDGDWNICVKWASDNGIPINPDEKTYDPNALNFVSVSAFTDADQNYIAGYCEERQVVNNGKATGEKRRVCQNGTATWTPGDVNVAMKRGGLVAVASTREYMWQMPAIIITNKQWAAQNPALVENFITAALEGGEAVKSSDAALARGSVVAAAVFKEESPEWWSKYYKGTTEKDKTGQLIQLGGSTVNGFADNAYLFGLNGNDNLYKRVYTVFGEITSKYYPNELPKVIPYDQVVNTRYLQGVLSKATNLAAPAAPVYNAQAQGTVVAKRSYAIEFDTGRATFTPVAVKTLDDVLNSIAVTGLSVQVNGHTDNIGSQEANIELSKKRAEAVKNWLIQNSNTITAARVRTRAYGDTQPVVDNTSAAGRARNRRVEIILLDTQ